VQTQTVWDCAEFLASTASAQNRTGDNADCGGNHPALQPNALPPRRVLQPLMGPNLDPNLIKLVLRRPAVV
jgi:hypothetical protein